MDAEYTGDFRKLQDCVKHSRTDMQVFLRNRERAWKEYVGSHYSTNGASLPVYLNFIELAVAVFEQNLMQSPPRVMCRTDSMLYRPAGYLLESVLNRRLAEPRIFDAIQQAVRAAFFMAGVLKVGIKAAPAITVQGFQIERQVPFISHITMDNWVQDMTAESWDEMDYRGNRYSVRMDELESIPGADPEMLAQVKPRDGKNDYNSGDSGQERLGVIQGQPTEKGDYVPRADFWDLYMPHDNVIVTIDAAMSLPRPLAVNKWTGPDGGPFRRMLFDEVEGTTQPLPPVATWMAMHLLENTLFRKLANQAKRSKIIATMLGGDSEAEAAAKVEDGAVIAAATASPLNNVEVGGIDQKLFALMLQNKQLQDYFAGNVSMVGGLSPGSETVGQDRIMQAGASMRVAKYQQKLQKFLKDVVTDFAWWLWNDPIESYPAEVHVEGYGPIQQSLTPTQRQHAFAEHYIEIDPYAMQYRTPGEVMTQITGLFQGVLLPLVPVLQAQGVNMDAKELLDFFARYGNFPELRKIFQQNGLPLMGPDDQKAQAGSSKTPELGGSVDKRMSPQGRDQVLINTLLNGNVQQGEMDAMMQRMAG